MPANKKAMTRYALIDRMLSNRYRAYSIQDITEILSETLEEYGEKAVSKRCVEKDLNYLVNDSPFNVELEEYWIDATDKNDRPYRKRCIRYEDPTFSIFKPKLTDDEKTVLATALDALGCFDGLDNFEWLNDLKSRLNVVERSPIISISKNLLENSTIIARLFTAIRQKQVIQLDYRTFKDNESHSTEIIPRILKEYNNRWFLIASACDTDRILTFPLDRVNDFKEIHTKKFKPLSDDLEDRFDEIIGITFIEDAPLEKIIFWVSDKSKDYVKTKPLHGSQKNISGAKEHDLRDQYPLLARGNFFTLECRENYELIRELTSFGAELVVISPNHIREKILQLIEKMRMAYQAINGEL